ncbi:MAG: glutathione S-transferase family protein [Stappiaceae bacterium]
MRLYDYILSGNAYKARLILAFLDVKHESTAVDFHPGKEHKSPAFLAINPAGTLPVLVDGDHILTDSAAILVYVALNHDPAKTWFPVEQPTFCAQIVSWLAFAEQLTTSIGVARLHDMLGRDADIQNARATGHQALRRLDSHLVEQEFKGSRYLVGKTPTIADIACFPYTALAGDGGISLMAYPAVNRWLISIRSLDGFIEMPGIHALHGSDTAPDLPWQSGGSERE